jgi:hypothetical protein
VKRESALGKAIRQAIGKELAIVGKYKQVYGKRGFSMFALLA